MQGKEIHTSTDQVASASQILDLLIEVVFAVGNLERSKFRSSAESIFSPPKNE